MRKGFTLSELMIAVAIVIIIVSIFVPPYFEMRTFNKFSDTKATYLDAVFSELRVLAGDK